MNDKLIYLIESGPALQAVKDHISERKRVQSEVRALAECYGVEQGSICRSTGVLLGVQFKPRHAHPDFCKPKKGISYPKKGTEAETAFKQQKGYESASETISELFCVPLWLNWTHPDGSSGGCCVAFPLTECGFLYLSESGPYAMWIPDVPGAIARMEAEGKRVEQTFNPDLPGCRQLMREEWDFMVAQHQLDKKRRELELSHVE
ncbi:hypothetical protein [Pulveribacter sp.]|uniref:hypothetical protein n=1 Tax=Pulveribacter sp. TaxID=2678893 RepID=UPI0028A77A33|nr:hypothetical protein [Pulveribacter sp.]